jgi:hypothetical protein
LIERAEKSNEGGTSYVTARTCALFHEGVVEHARVLLWAEKAVAADSPKTAWTLHTLALAHYRAGNLDQTVGFCLESLKADPNWDGRMLNRFLGAMALVRLGKPEQARECLRSVAQWRKEVADGTYKGRETFRQSRPVSELAEVNNQGRATTVVAIASKR